MGVILYQDEGTGCPKAYTSLSTVSAALIKHLVLPTPCLLSPIDSCSPCFPQAMQSVNFLCELLITDMF